MILTRRAAPPPQAAAPPAREQVGDRRHRWLLLTVLFLAAALRFPLLTSIPVGLHYDEAWSGLDAATISWRHHPIFFTDSNGMEPLYLYAQALSMQLFGRTAFALRLPSALIGLATVAALWLLGRALGGRRLGLFAAALLAVTYWHVHVSRLGYRAISLPLVECLAWWALWHGTLQRDRRWLAAGGALVGLSLYTYSTARAFPFAVALWFLWLALARRQWRPVLELAGVMLAALVVFSPLGWYFLQHPHEFMDRIGQVVVLSPALSKAGPPPVLTGVLRTLGMFSIHGDPQWKYNLSGKPTFDPLVSLAFYLGIAFALGAAFRALRPRGAAPTDATLDAFPVPPAGAALLLCWFAVLLVPGFVTTDPPETLHTLATVPAVCTFPALGFLVAWRWLQRRWPRCRSWGLPLAAALIGAEGIATALSYFLIWAPNPQTYYWLHGDVADLAARLERAPAGTDLYVSTEYYQHPTIRFLAPNAAPRLIWFEAKKSLPVRPDGAPALYAFAHGFGPLPEAPAALPASDLVAAPRDRDGAVEYRLYALPAGATEPDLTTPLQATVGDAVQLVGASVTPPTAEAPDRARVTLRWRVVRPTPARLSLFVHLLDPSGYRWAQSDGQGFFSADWQSGDEVVSTEEVDLPLGTPAVPLRVSVDFYDVASGAPLPIQTTSGHATAPDGGLVVGSVRPVPLAPTAERAVPGARPAQELAPGVALIGADVPVAAVPAGQPLAVTLYLRKSIAGPVADPAVRLDGLSAADVEPVSAAALLATLPAGDVLAVRHLLTVPARALAAQALVQVRAGPDTWVRLGSVSIVSLARDFAAPVPQHPLAVRFGSVAELLGYDIRQDQAAPTRRLTLYWKALDPSDVSYTVFTHLVGADGTLRGQHDGLPAEDHWPTTAWLPGQIIADLHVLALPNPGTIAGATIQVGLYDARNGARLPTSGPAGQAGDTYAVLRP